MFAYLIKAGGGLQSAWPLSLRVLDLSSNVGIFGPLPPAGSGYADLTTVDLSNTSVSGALPSSWSLFPSLQRLVATDTAMTCALEFNATDGAVSGEGEGDGRRAAGRRAQRAARWPQPGPFQPPPLRRATGAARSLALTRPLLIPH
jgi:hypothetical protein